MRRWAVRGKAQSRRRYAPTPTNRERVWWLWIHGERLLPSGRLLFVHEELVQEHPAARHPTSVCARVATRCARIIIRRPSRSFEDHLDGE